MQSGAGGPDRAPTGSRVDPPADPWVVGRYERFRAERERPGRDLLARVPSCPGGRAVDLGCGTGRLTVALAEATGAAEVVGVDSSPAMLAAARDLAATSPTVRVVEADLRDPDAGWTGGAPAEGLDVVFSNAALQWVPDHETLVPELVGRLAVGGTIAFQVPANFDHPSHLVADEVGRRHGLPPQGESIGVLGPRAYAELLHSAGVADPVVDLHVYGHALARTDEVIDFVSGTLLTTAERLLGPEALEAFRAEYRARLLAELGDPDGDRPYWFGFTRILCSGVRTA